MWRKRQLLEIMRKARRNGWLMLRQSHSWGIRKQWSTAEYLCSSHINHTPVPCAYYESLYHVENYVFLLLQKMMKLAVLGGRRGWGRCWTVVSDELSGSQRLIHSFGKCSSAWNTLSDLVLESITDGLWGKSLKDKPICYYRLVLFPFTPLPRLGQGKK